MNYLGRVSQSPYLAFQNTHCYLNPKFYRVIHALEHSLGSNQPFVGLFPVQIPNKYATFILLKLLYLLHTRFYLFWSNSFSNLEVPEGGVSPPFSVPLPHCTGARNKIESHHRSQSSVELMVYLSQEPKVVVAVAKILLVYQIRDLLASVVVEVTTMSHSFLHP